MGLYVNTNTQSIFAQRALGKNTFNLQKSIEKLSTGFKINRAGDDAAGLTIAEKMTAQVRGLAKAEQNALDGISLIQTAEGALSVIQDNLQRIRELMVQAQNGTNGADEANALQREANERITTIDAIAKATKFNGTALIYQPGANITLQVGADNAQTTTIKLANGGNANEGINIDIAAAVATKGGINEGAGAELSKMLLDASVTIKAQDNTAGAAQTLANMDTRINNISRMRSELGAQQNALESRIDYLQVARENMEASRSRIRDTDVASESSNLAKNQILQQSAAAMLAQANNTPGIALNLLP